MNSWSGAKFRLWPVLGVVVFIGATGSRTIDATIVPENGTVTILALGTSLTANYGWPQKLAQVLSQCLVRQVEIEVLAVPGANSEQAERQFNSRRIPKPDIVLVEFASNDADILDGVTLSQSRRNHNALVARIHADAEHSRIVLMTMSPAFGLRGWLRPSLGNYNAIYRDLAASNHLDLADLNKVWNEFLAATDHKEHLPDGLHPTQVSANKVILPVVLGKIVNLPGIQGKKHCITP
jgi:acyl-CoA thioesterase-1